MQNEWLQTIGNMYWFFMLVAYPLTIRNGYFDIATSKLVFFYAFSLLFIIANLVIRGACKVKKIPSGAVSLPKNEAIILIVLSACFFISYLINGDYLYKLWGPGEQHMSILFLGITILVYFFLRQIPFNKLGFTVCAVIGSSLVSLLAVLQFFGLDPIGLFGAVSPYTNPYTFMATMSNRDLVGFYFDIMFPFGFYLATLPKWRVLGFAGVILTGMGIIVCDTDAAILCFVAELVLLALLCIDKPDFSKVFPICIGILGVALALTGYYEKKIESTLSLSFIHRLFINPIVGGALVAIAILLFVLVKTGHVKVIKGLAWVALILICLYPLYMAVYTHFREAISTDESLPYDSFLRFDNGWGSHRGIIWKISLFIFGENSFLQKLFGNGVEGYPLGYVTACMTYEKFAEGSYLPYPDAHNMYLHFLVEYGIFGTAAGVALFVYRLKTMLCDTDEDCFYRVKAVALLTAMINAIFLFCNNINMAFIPGLL